MHIRIPALRAFIGSSLVVLLLPLAAIAQDARPRILVTNDDGIGSRGLAALVTELEKFADVIAVAPAEDFSGGSHSTVVRTRGAEVRPFMRDGKLVGYGITATPADAAKFGIQHLGRDQPFDLVVSGINAGANTGNIAHYSGTVGAAMEGLYHGIPSIATSQAAQQDYALSARITADVVQRVLRDGLPPGVLLSINIPAGELRGVKAAPMGGSYFGIAAFQQVSAEGDAVSYRATLRGADRGGEFTDTAFYLDGYVTITPLRFDWTDYELLARLHAWDMTVGP